MEPLVVRDERGIDDHIDELMTAMLWKLMVRSKRRPMEAGINSKLTARKRAAPGGR